MQAVNVRNMFDTEALRTEVDPLKREDYEEKSREMTKIGSEKEEVKARKTLNRTRLIVQSADYFVLMFKLMRKSMSHESKTMNITASRM